MSKLKPAKYPQYTKIFSNVATPMKEPKFVEDIWDPYQELENLQTVMTSDHVIFEFEAGLHCIKEDKFKMRDFAKRL